VFAVLTRIPYVLAQRFPLKRDQVHSRNSRAFFWRTGDVSLLDVSWSPIRFVTSSTAVQGSFLSLLHKLPADKPVSVCVSVFRGSWVRYAFSYYREMREREAQQARLAAQTRRSEAECPSLQLNPHFSSIASMQ